MKIAYIDCFAGISGDMFIGAMIDAGLDIALLKKELKKLPLTGYSVRYVKEKRRGIAGRRFIVDVKSVQARRSLPDILGIINRSGLSEKIKKKSAELFNMLAASEAKVHGTCINNVHFHEVGAVDSIIDIIGAVIGTELLGIGMIYSSVPRVGAVPAPAVLELLCGLRIKGTGREEELVTPTGALFLKGLVNKTCPVPDMEIDRIGYGAGSRDSRDIPNVLRIILGHKKALSSSVYVVETNIDDMNPQCYGPLMEKLFKRGALDVFWTPVQMKKNRPGVLVSVLCPWEKLEDMINVLFGNTTTFGVRYYETGRRIMRRRFAERDKIIYKIGSYMRKAGTASPEFDALRAGNDIVRSARTYKNIPKSGTPSAESQYTINKSQNSHSQILKQAPKPK